MSDPRLATHRPDDEAAVLAQVFLRPERFTDVAAALTLNDFAREAHRLIFASMTRLVAGGHAPNFRAVLADLEQRDDMDRVDRAYFASLLDAGHIGVRLATYIELVRDATTRRTLRKLGADLEAQATQAAADAPDMLARTQRTLREIEARVSGREGDVVDQSTLLAAVDARVRALLDGAPLAGLASGFARLDATAGPLAPGQLWTLAGRTGLGKTSCALQIAMHAAATVPVAFFSVEMSAEELLLRVVAQRARIDSRQLFRGILPGHQHALVQDALADLATRQWAIVDSGTQTIASVRRHCERMRAAGGLGLVVVDYLQLLDVPKGGSQDSRTQQVGALSRGLKVLARDLEVPVLALSQLSRATDARAGKRPQLSDLRESGSIEHDSDKVLFIHADDSSEPVVEATLIVSKNRQGPTGSVPMMFVRQSSRFEEAEYARF